MRDKVGGAWVPRQGALGSWGGNVGCAGELG